MRRTSACLSSFIVLITLGNSATMAKATNDYNYDPSVSEFSGRIEWKKYYDHAPPYYEAKDNPPIIRVPVLIPDQPVNVIATSHTGPNEDSFYAVRVLEFGIRDDDTFYKIIGHHIKVIGYFDEATTGYQYTDVTFFAKSVALEK